jgi:methylated-DNA-protein-cysteine methyltransferase-like protein
MYVSEFAENVYNVLSGVPKGSVVTYGDIARLCGRPRAAREVGWVMHHCPEGVPWHRVVMATGKFMGGELQRALLCEDGIGFREDGTVDLDKYRMRAEV